VIADLAIHGIYRRHPAGSESGNAWIIRGQQNAGDVEMLQANDHFITDEPQLGKYLVDTGCLLVDRCERARFRVVPLLDLVGEGGIRGETVIFRAEAPADHVCT